MLQITKSKDEKIIATNCNWNGNFTSLGTLRKTISFTQKKKREKQ